MAATYAVTGSYAEAARSIGREDPSVARKALLRLANPVKSQLHARACEAGLRAGRKRLVTCLQGVGDLLAGELKGGSVEPADVAHLSRSLSSLVTALAKVGERVEASKSERLRRTKLRTEIDVLERETGLTVERIATAIAGLSRDEKVALRDLLKPAPAAPLSNATEVTASPPPAAPGGAPGDPHDAG